MTTTSLAFNGIQLNPIVHNSQIWLTSSELAKALGYSRSDKVTQLYNRNKDEFSDGMSRIVLQPQNEVIGEFSGLQREIRIFSLRGCHLVAMFAKTDTAKLFRVWVLDILDKEIKTQLELNGLPEPAIITKAQRGELFDRVKLISANDGKLRTQIWSRFQNHFKTASYKDLPYDKFNEAVDYLDKLKQEYCNGIETHFLSDNELHQLIDKAVCEHLKTLPH